MVKDGIISSDFEAKIEPPKVMLTVLSSYVISKILNMLH